MQLRPLLNALFVRPGPLQPILRLSICRPVPYSSGFARSNRRRRSRGRSRRARERRARDRGGHRSRHHQLCRLRRSGRAHFQHRFGMREHQRSGEQSYASNRSRRSHVRFPLQWPLTSPRAGCGRQRRRHARRSARGVSWPWSGDGSMLQAWRGPPIRGRWSSSSRHAGIATRRRRGR